MAVVGKIQIAETAMYLLLLKYVIRIVPASLLGRDQTFAATIFLTIGHPTLQVIMFVIMSIGGLAEQMELLVIRDRALKG